MRLMILVILGALLCTIGYIVYATGNAVPMDFQSVAVFAFSALNFITVLALLWLMQRGEKQPVAEFGQTMRDNASIILTLAFLMLIYSGYDIAKHFGLVP